MYENFTFAELESMKRDLVECLKEARSINDWAREQEINEKLDALFDAELEVMPDADDHDTYWNGCGGYTPPMLTKEEASAAEDLAFEAYCMEWEEASEWLESGEEGTWVENEGRTVQVYECFAGRYMLCDENGEFEAVTGNIGEAIAYLKNGLRDTTARQGCEEP